MTVSQAARAPAQASGQTEMALIFRIAGEAFALSVDWVHEILDPIETTPVPNAASFAPALVNVRGAIVPLLDVRDRLRMPPAPPGAEARMIVLELEVEGVPTRVAVTADAVEEVIETDMAALVAVPELGARWPDEYIHGVARHGDDLVILLNADRLFRPEI